ncbi:MAG: hypothetical protein MAG453_01422 [Calditrichaeota bacterium]|nr:hypothetical protein [Calditrichota bacterium]
MRAAVPTLVSLANVAMGAAGAVLFLSGFVEIGLVAIVIASLLDVIDGWVARKIGAEGEKGVAVDASADLASFGIVPAVILVATWNGAIGWAAAVLYAAAITFRLVRFARTKTEPGVFQGMPSPTAAIAVAGACVFAVRHPALDWIAPAGAVVFAAIAASKISYPKLGHRAFRIMPVAAQLVIYAIHGALFIMMPGLAALSLMLVYAVLGPTLLKLYRIRENALTGAGVQR